MNRELSLASARATGSMVIVGSTPSLSSTTGRSQSWDASEAGCLDTRLTSLGEWDNHIISEGSGGCGCHVHTDFSSLPDEIILSILAFLDISDLYALTKVASLIPPSPHITLTHKKTNPDLSSTPNHFRGPSSSP